METAPKAGSAPERDDGGWSRAVRTAGLVPVAVAIVFFAACATINASYHTTLWEAEADGFHWYIQQFEPTGAAEWAWQRPPLYLALSAPIHLVGASGFRAGQIVSALAGACLIWVGAVLAALLSRDRNAARLAALFLAINTTVVYTSLLAATDALFGLLATVGLAGLAADRRHRSVRALALSGAAFGLAYTTRYQGAVFLLVGAVAALAVGRQAASRAARPAAYGLGVVLGLAPAALFARRFMGVPIEYVLWQAVLDHPDLSASAYGPAERIVNALTSYAYSTVPVVLAVGPFLVVACVAGLVFRTVPRDRLGGLGLYAVAALLYWLEVGWRFSHRVGWQEFRFFAPVVAATTVAAALVLTSIRRRALRIPVIALGVLISAGISASFLIPRFDHGTPGHLEFARELQRATGRDDLRLLVTSHELALSLDSITLLDLGYIGVPKKKMFMSTEAAGPLPLPDHDVVVLRRNEADLPPGRSPLVDQIRETHDLRFCAGGFCALFPRNGPPAP